MSVSPTAAPQAARFFPRSTTNSCTDAVTPRNPCSSAAPAYGLTPAQLSASLGQHNPVDRVASLVIAHVPLFAIHGDSDKIVPLENNSGLLHKRIRALGSSMELIVPAGQGHSLWAGFFECRELVAFVKMHALSRAP